MGEPPAEEKYRAPALSKGLDILEMLASETRGKSQIEIAKALGRTTSEIFRMLMVLRQRGYIEQSEDGDRYALTTKMFEMAHRHPPIRRLNSLAAAEMQRLADEINQSIHLAILHSGKVLVIAQVDCLEDTLTSVRLGAQLRLLETASGRVLAAWMDERALDNLRELSGESGANWQQFTKDLKEVAHAGYCESPSLTIEGVINISAPIRDYSGNVIAAMTIPYVRRLSGSSNKDVPECLTALRRVSHNLSRQLGARIHE